MKKYKKIWLLAFVIIMSLVLYSAGHFLLTKEKSPAAAGENVQVTQTPTTKAVVYQHVRMTIGGNAQEINILEVDPGAPGVSIRPALSYDSTFGFEKLSSIARRNKAYAAANAGFFFKYGSPAGLVVSKGEVLSLTGGSNPVFMVHDGKAELREWSPVLRVRCKTYLANIHNVNVLEPKSSIALYTPFFGSESRLEEDNYTVVVKDNKVVSASLYHGSVKIPDDSLLLCFLRPSPTMIKNLPFAPGDSVDLEIIPPLGKDFTAYECGSWLVKNGRAAAGEADPWVGVLTNRDPRTLIGIKGDGKVVLLTVDGRQPGYSTGMTARELAEFAVDYGIRDAAMLDGGASTEMVVDGRMVNRPSGGGQERPVGGGIIIKTDGQ